MAIRGAQLDSNNGGRDSFLRVVNGCAQAKREIGGNRMDDTLWMCQIMFRINDVTETHSRGDSSNVTRTAC
jgi:hypothetical protein